VCNTDLGTVPPDVCPVCFTVVTAVPQAAEPVDDRNDPVDDDLPDVANTGRPGSCATEGCTGVPPAGEWYCVTCQLVNETATARFVLSGPWGDVTVPDLGELVIGRSPVDAPTTAGMLESADRVSRVHAVVERRGGTLIVVDRSANGTTVNGQRVPRGEERTVLPGDRLVLGTQVEFEVRGI